MTMIDPEEHGVRVSRHINSGPPAPGVPVVEFLLDEISDCESCPICEPGWWFPAAYIEHLTRPPIVGATLTPKDFERGSQALDAALRSFKEAQELFRGPE